MRAEQARQVPVGCCLRRPLSPLLSSTQPASPTRPFTRPQTWNARPCDSLHALSCGHTKLLIKPYTGGETSASGRLIAARIQSSVSIAPAHASEYSKLLGASRALLVRALWKPPMFYPPASCSPTLVCTADGAPFCELVVYQRSGVAAPSLPLLKHRQAVEATNVARSMTHGLGAPSSDPP